MPVVLIDLDEVLFPFALTYRAWRALEGLDPISQSAWDSYGINETHIPGHQSLMAEFFASALALATPPVESRAEDCRVLASTHEVIGCTGRYADTEGAPTWEWVRRWVPFVAQIEFCGWHPEAGQPSGKADVARRLGAQALLDDSAVHLKGLPSSACGLLVERPAGTVSERGALPWDEAMRQLRSRLE